MGPGCVCVCERERECVYFIASHFQNSLVVQWLGHCTFTAKGLSSVLDQGTNTPQAAQQGQNKKKVTFKKTVVTSIINNNGLK